MRWKCEQYLVIVSCSQVLRDNCSMYMAHVCFYVFCSDCAGVCGNICSVSEVVKGSGFHEPRSSGMNGVAM